MGTKQKITPFLWFDTQAEEAAAFYTSLFPNSRIRRVTHYGAAGPGKAGTVMTAEFELDGQVFVALNGGPAFHFTEAISLVVNCESQAEVDRYWKELSAGGSEGQCGWLKDRFGLFWQIVPEGLVDAIQGPDPAGSRRATQAMLGMRKLDLPALRQAYQGG